MPRTIDREQRKEQLAHALWRIIVERGIGAVSVRTVAEEAGVVVGSLRHVFPTRAELLAFSAELMVRRATDRILALPRPQEKLDYPQYALQVVRQLLPLEPDSRAELEVNLALIAEAPALPELATIRDHAYQQIAALCTELVQNLTRRPRDGQTIAQARRLHALIDGLAIHLLHSPSEDSAWAIEIVEGEIAQMARATPPDATTPTVGPSSSNVRGKSEIPE
ncbi:MAG: TetR family transcriptional regulator C-terminal domain-containing protein [Candidatus Nanopelagicales bacterium]